MKNGRPHVVPPKQPRPFGCPTSWCWKGGGCPTRSSPSRQQQRRPEQLLGCAQPERRARDSQARYQLRTQCSCLLRLSSHTASFIFSNDFLLPLMALFRVGLFFLLFFFSFFYCSSTQSDPSLSDERSHSSTNTSK